MLTFLVRVAGGLSAAADPRARDIQSTGSRLQAVLLMRERFFRSLRSPQGPHCGRRRSRPTPAHRPAVLQTRSNVLSARTCVVSERGKRQEPMVRGMEASRQVCSGIRVVRLRRLGETGRVLVKCRGFGGVAVGR